VNQTELAEALGVTRRTIADWDKEGLAEAGRVSDRPVEYDELFSLRWAWANKRAGGSPAQKDAKNRKLLAEAEMKEHELATMKGTLAVMDEVVDVWTDVLSRVRARIIAFKGSLAPRLVGLDDPREVKAVLDPAMNELIEELREIAAEIEEVAA